MPDLVVQMLWVVALGLSAARISVLIIDDTILEPLRERIYFRWPPKDNPAWGFDYQTRDSKGNYLPTGAHREWSRFGELMTCNRCMTVWITGMLYVVAVNWGPIEGGEVEHLLKMVAAMWIASWGASKIA